jgi:hypothetical protein
MSETPVSPYGSRDYQSAQVGAAEAKARARAAIEAAIATLQTHRQHLTEGQEKEIKKILYGPID